MSDQESRFVIAFDGKTGTINNVLAAIKGQVRSAVSEIESTTSKIDAFKGLEKSVDDLGKKFMSAQDRAAEFRRQIAQLQGDGKDVGTELVKALRQTEAEITRTSKAYGRQSDALAAMRSSLTAAGVDVSKLAAEELRLADALKKANAAAAQQASKDVLGLKTFSDIAPKIREAQAAFNTLRSSGKLTQTELAQAQVQLNARIAELRGQVTGAANAARAGGPTLASMFSGAIAPALGLATTFATITAGIAASVAAARDYANEQARLATVTNLSREQLDQYGSAVRTLAREVGVDLVTAQKTFTDLVREGIGEPEALLALQVSAVAAKASFSDLNVVAKVGADLMSAYGLKAEDLRLAFDQIITAAKNDGPTFEQLAPSIGSTAVAAQAAGVEFRELVAMLNVMASASGDGAGAVTALQKILVSWNTDEVRQKLNGLNIEARDFTGAMRELAGNKIPIDKLVDLGIAGSRSAVGVAALTRSAGELDAALSRADTAAGAAQSALIQLYDSPQGRSDRFNAQLQDAQVNLGNLVGTGSKLAEAATFLLRQFNEIPAAFREAERASKATDASLLSIAKAFLQTSPLAAETARSMGLFGGATQATIDKVKAADGEIKRIAASFGGLSKSLVDGIQALQAGTAKSIAEAQALADAQVAALDRSAGSIAATAAQTLAIQTRLAAEKLAIITANETAVTAALEKAIAAREAALKDGNKKERQIALETARLRLAALEPILAQYVAHYNALVAQAQSYRSRMQEIEQARLAFNEGLEKTLFNIRVSGLSAFDQYVEKVKESERLIALAREAGAKGNIQLAEKYTQEAIALSGTLEKVVRDDGTVIVGQFDVQQTKINLLKKAGEGLNKTYEEQGAAAKKGADTTVDQINAVLPRLNELQATVKALNAEAAKGAKLKLEMDQASFSQAEARIAELTRDREVVIHVREVQEKSLGGPIQRLGRGGMLGDLVQRFAGGGTVFRRPSWAKVPGSGDGDTVPAALQAGSFVVRKSASRYYGDGLMGRLARGFANGGPVPFLARLAGGGYPGMRINPSAKPPAEIRRWIEDKWGYDPFAGYDPETGRYYSNRTDTPTSAPTIDPKKGYRSGDSFQSNEPPISFDTRPVPDEAITARNVLEYAREMLNMVGLSNPLLGSLGPSMQRAIAAVERNPADLVQVKALLQMAETIGSNPYLFAMWGKTAGATSSATPIWFIDWLQQHRAGDLAGGGGSVSSSTASTEFARQFFGGNQLLQNGPGQRVKRRMAGGGSAGDTDTVPALLTPGEFVIRRSAASKYGAGLLHAINSMRISRGALANMFAAPQVARFAFGGEVGFGVPERGMPGAGGAKNYTINVNASPGDLLSADNVRRWIIPAIDDIQRRTR